MRFSFPRHPDALLLLLAAATTTTTTAFHASPAAASLRPLTSAMMVRRTTTRTAASLADDTTATINGAATQQQPTTYECDAEADCVVVPACDTETCRTSLDVRIHNTWYDLSGWRKAHPAGEHWIDYYDGRDATDVMDAFHSDKGRKMVTRLPQSTAESVQLLQETVPDDTPTQLNFRTLRAQLEADGWWERDMRFEATQLGIWASLVIAAGACAHSVPLLSTSLLAVAMTSAGWLGHDYVHGVDAFAFKLRNFVAFSGGLGALWWSDKHNKHHALTNEQGVDEDIATDPFLYTWAPDPSQDSPLRKIQHWIFWLPFSLLFALWRVDSLKVAIEAVEQKRTDAKTELYAILTHYAILCTVFPASVWVPAVFVNGLLSALIVTPTHQSEELFPEYQPDWVTAQFLSTRNAVTTNPFSEWIWGGMQYQLEHHLFPSMPRHRYPELKPILQKFCEDNNIPGGYRESGEWEILRMNWEKYREVAQQPAVEGAPLTKGRLGQQAAIVSTGSPAATTT